MTYKIVSSRPAQIGLAKQTAVGAHNPPSATVGLWPRWQDGSSVGATMADTAIMEGDGSLDAGIHMKTGQWGTATLNCIPRPKELAMLLAAFTGTASDVATIVASGPNYSHVITPSATGYVQDVYTIACNIGQTGAGPEYIELSDAICHNLHITANPGQPDLRVEAQFTGITNLLGTTLASSAYLTDDEFAWWTSAGNWTLASTLFGANNADWQKAARGIDITLTRELRPENFIAESVTPGPLYAGARSVTGTIPFFYQDPSIQGSAFMGGPAGTVDNSAVVYGNIQFQFACASDATQTFTLQFPNASFKNPRLSPVLAGDPLVLSTEFQAFRRGGSPVYTATVINTATTAY